MQVEVQEAYGKQDPRRYPLDPPDPKSVTGEDSSTHNRGMGGPLARLPLSMQPGEVLVQVWPHLSSTSAMYTALVAQQRNFASGRTTTQSCHVTTDATCKGKRSWKATSSTHPY